MRKRGKSRFSSGPKRALRFRLKYATDPLCHRAKVLLPVKYAHLETALINLDDFEITLFDAFETEGIPEELWPFYMAWAKRKMKKGLHFWDSTFNLEGELLRQEFVLRGLDETTLNNLEPIVDAWIGAFRGVCPSGEQLENPGFETGALDPWVTIDPIKVTVTNVDKHSGTYSLKMMGGGSNDTSQELETPIPVSCVTAFNVWAKRSPGVFSMTLGVLIYYEDGVGPGEEFYLESGDWVKCDLKAALTPGKTIVKILFICTGLAAFYIYVDDWTLYGT